MVLRTTEKYEHFNFKPELLTAAEFGGYRGSKFMLQI